MLSAIEAGATAVIQPGGSVRDQEVINAANEKEIAMVMTVLEISALDNIDFERVRLGIDISETF